MTPSRPSIAVDVEGFAIDEAARPERRAKVLVSDGLEFFARTCFPHYIKSAPSRLHAHLYADLPEMLTKPAAAGRKGRRKLKIAPRGAAKSTIVSQIFVLCCRRLAGG